MSKVKITFLIACFGSLIPAWIGSGMLEQIDSSDTLFESNTGIIILALFAIGFWGTSFAYFYLGKIKYGILSGIGKWALILIGVWIFHLTNGPAEGHHPYIIFLGILFAALWAILDFGMLYPLAKKRNLEQ